MINCDVLRSAAPVPCALRLLMPCLLLIGSGLVAASDSSFDKQAYIGFGVGRANLSPTADRGSDFDIAGESNGSISLSLGRDFSKRFTGELVYADVGNLLLADGSRAEFSDISLAGLVYLFGASDRRDGFASYARVGVGELKVVNDPGFERDNDMHPVGGIGVEYTLRSGVSARADYVYLDSDAEYVSLSLLYRIGVDEEVSPAVPAAIGGSAETADISSPAPASMESEDSSAESSGLAASTAVQDVENLSLAGNAASDTVERIDDSFIGEPEFAESVDGSMQSTESSLHPCEPDGCEALTDTFSGITFQIGSATLTAESAALLDDVAGLMTLHPDLSLRLQSHTDSIGDPELNLELSKQRALAVFQYLKARGITADRVSARAFGGTRPVASNDTQEGRRANRRVDLLFSR